MPTVFALLCFVVVIHWLIFPYPSGLLHWHCGNLTIAPVPAKQPWWIWINTSCEFIMNDYITTTKQSTTKPCAYFLGYTVYSNMSCRKWIPLLRLFHLQQIPLLYCCVPFGVVPFNCIHNLVPYNFIFNLQIQRPSAKGVDAQFSHTQVHCEINNNKELSTMIITWH